MGTAVFHETNLYVTEGLFLNYYWISNIKKWVQRLNKFHSEKGNFSADHLNKVKQLPDFFPRKPTKVHV